MIETKNNDFSANFLPIINDCRIKFDKKKEMYGDSWKRMSYPELQVRLKEEFEEYDFNKDKVESIVYDELLDIINCAVMYAKHLRKYMEMK